MVRIIFNKGAPLKNVSSNFRNILKEKIREKIQTVKEILNLVVSLKIFTLGMLL
jgi:hypothetical protein